MKKNLGLKLLSILLVFAVLASCVPLMASADESKIRFGVVSDIHYLAPSLKGGTNEEWIEFVNNKHKEYNEIDSLIDNALDGIKRNAIENGENYVLIPGDLTKDGELESHKALVKKLEAFEKESGLSVLVIPGNHDIHNSNATSYKNGEKEPAEITTPEQFREIYKNLGYDLADSFFVPESGKKGGMLSYAATLGNYRIIGIDSCMYSEDNGAKGNEHKTDGKIADGLLDWIVAESEKAKESGLTVIGMQHHNLIPHSAIEEATLQAFVVRDWMRVAEAYADAGMHYVFTGHLHANDTNSHISDNGEIVYDILTPTITGFPNYYKIVDFTSNGNKSTMDMQTVDVDKYQPVVDDYGNVFKQPYKISRSFDQTFGDGGLEAYVNGIVSSFVSDIFGDIQAEGGLLKYLASLDLDLEKIIVDALGTNGLALGSIEILTVSSNVMGFLEDFAGQVEEKYVNKPEETVAKLKALIHKLLSYEVSELKATLLSEELGYEINEGGCTLNELGTTILYSYYGGDEDMSRLNYMADVLANLESGKLAQEIFNLLRDVLVTDLVQNEILANLDFNPGELFPQGNVFYLFGRILQGIVEALLGGDNSFLNLVDSVLAIPLVPEEYSSIDAIIDHLMNEYLTQSQYEAWGYTMSWMLGSFLLDYDPDEMADSNISVTYSGPVEVEATQDNYRLPSHVAVTLGEDSSTQVNITWLTKYSVKGSDIEIVEYSENPKFTGKATTGSGINASSESIDKTYPGADLGIISFLPFTKDYVKHTIKLTELKPGTKYSYRVGDAELGWWSEAGTITTAEGEDEGFTFFYLTDPQAQRKDQYERFATVLETAYDLYPNGRFVVSAGDQVDAGENVKHWNYMLNSTNALLDLPFMPTTGNHEDEGAVISENFILPNVPEQDEDTGVYYSYDYNGVHFTVLNTNDIEDDKLSDAQLNWLKKDVKSSDAKWKIVVLHKAPYSNGSHYDDDDVVGIRNQLATLLPYLGVDLVLQGHDHVYLRTDVMNTNAVIPAEEKNVTFEGLEYRMKYNPKGTIYSICGTSGVKVYKTKDVEATDELFPRAQALSENAENSMFSAITVEGDSLYYNAYEVENGKAIRVDSFGIEKSESKAPADKINNDKIEEAFENLISKVDIKYIWKFIHFVFSAVNTITGFFGKMF